MSDQPGASSKFDDLVAATGQDLIEPDREPAFWAQADCAACGGTGRNSKGHPCTPCNKRWTETSAAPARAEEDAFNAATCSCGRRYGWAGQQRDNPYRCVACAAQLKADKSLRTIDSAPQAERIPAGIADAAEDVARRAELALFGLTSPGEEKAGTPSQEAPLQSSAEDPPLACADCCADCDAVFTRRKVGVWFGEPARLVCKPCNKRLSAAAKRAEKSATAEAELNLLTGELHLVRGQLDDEFAAADREYGRAVREAREKGLANPIAIDAYAAQEAAKAARDYTDRLKLETRPQIAWAARKVRDRRDEEESVKAICKTHRRVADRARARAEDWLEWRIRQWLETQRELGLLDTETSLRLLEVGLRLQLKPRVGGPKVYDEQVAAQAFLAKLGVIDATVGEDAPVRLVPMLNREAAKAYMLRTGLIVEGTAIEPAGGFYLSIVDTRKGDAE